VRRRRSIRCTHRYRQKRDEDEIVDIVDEAHPDAARIQDLETPQTVVFRAKQHERGRPPPIAANVVEVVEIHDMNRVAGRAEPRPCWRAGPEADDIDDVEFRARRGHTIG
jgi:hypothetical protein